MLVFDNEKQYLTPKLQRTITGFLVIRLSDQENTRSSGVSLTQEGGRKGVSEEADSSKCVK